jgi:hypothetical protein
MTEPKRRAFEDSFLPGGRRGGPDPGDLSNQERQRRVSRSVTALRLSVAYSEPPLGRRHLDE